MSKRHHGSSLDSLLKEEGVFEETQARAIKEAVVWQLTEAMAKQSLSNARLAGLRKTSRSQVDRLLEPSRTGTRRKKRIYPDSLSETGSPPNSPANSGTCTGTFQVSNLTSGAGAPTP